LALVKELLRCNNRVNEDRRQATQEEFGR